VYMDESDSIHGLCGISITMMDQAPTIVLKDGIIG